MSMLRDRRRQAVATGLDRSAGRLHFAGHDLPALVERHGSPLFVYSAEMIRMNCRALRSAFAMPGLDTAVAFASKACSLMRILEIVRDEGLCLEVNSLGELQKARMAGFADERIVLNGVAKSDAEIAAALSPPILSINVDGLGELGRIDAAARGLGVRARVSLRLVPELTGGTAPGNETASSRTKFGMTQAELREALAMLAASAATDLVGLHVHIGSQITSDAPYAKAAGFAVEAVAAIGRPLELLNLGGGFPVNYVHDDMPGFEPRYLASDRPLGDFARAMAGALAGRLDPATRIIVEPGRRLIADCAVALARVVARKDRPDITWLYVDAGYHTLLEAFGYKWYYHAHLADRGHEPADTEFRLVGPLCDNGDTFHDVEGEALFEAMRGLAPDAADRIAGLERTLVRLPRRRLLPASAGPGDVIAFQDAGAYTMDQIFAINGRGRPAVLLADRGEVEVIRRADSLADMLLNEVY
jgi:diaminopimelate decarboxylase